MNKTKILSILALVGGLGAQLGPALELISPEAAQIAGVASIGILAGTKAVVDIQGRLDERKQKKQRRRGATR